MNNEITFKLNCSQAVKNILIEAFQTYANLICPEPSSQYNEKIRQELLDTVEFIKNQAHQKSLTISMNLYTQYRSAVNFHFDRIRKELNTSVDKQNSLLLNAINGDIINDQHLDEAISKDLLLK